MLFMEHVRNRMLFQPKPLYCQYNIQGGAVNRGLFFAGPPLSPLAAVSGKISEIR
jgi:hypothetical protein